MREMNASACDALASGVRWDSPALIASLVVLGMIDLMVIGGNLLVITAVFVSSKLRTSVTNLFIASLAVADLLLGIAVLPFSAAWEVFNEVWLFGDVWCSVWLAVDVWMCTASILNLCAISLDRYLAVTRPVSYPSIMSCRRAKMLIAGVWILSFLICFPPLVGWNDHREDTTSLSASVDNEIESLPVVTTLYPMDTILSSSESMTQSPPLTFDEAVSEEEASWLEQTSYRHVVLQHHHFRHQNRHRFGSGDGSGGGSISIVSSQEISSSFSQESNWSSVSNSSIPPLRLLQRAPSISASSSSSTDILGSIDSSPSASPSPSDIIPCPWVCELTNDAGYVVYSALGSFYIPMLVMLFFYWRIYRAAVRTTKAINQGFRTTKGSKLLGVGFGGGGGSGSVGRGGGGGSGGSSFGGGVSRFDEHRLTLRIHRGRGSVMHHGTSQGNWGGSSSNCNYSNASEATSDGSPPASGLSPRRLVRSRTQDKIRINVTYQSEAGEGGGGPADGGGVPPSGRRGGSCRSTGGRVSTAAALASAASSAAGTALYSVHYTGSGGNNGSSPTGGGGNGRPDYALRREGSSRRSSARFDGSHQHLLRVSSTSSNNSSAASAALQRTESTRQRGRSSGETELIVPGRTTAGSVSPGTSPTTYESISVSSAAGAGDGGGSPGSSFGMSSCSIKRRQQQQQRNQQTQQQQQQQQQHVSRMGKRNIKAQVKRFRMETKAAKTLGIIVGGFIVCWLPFFTMYLVRAFCEDCIPPLVFSILFWLGYCNSAINPCIYALFSKDFRFAFKRIICKCFCTGRRGCSGGWNEGTAEAGGAFGGGGSWGSFRRRSQRQSPHQQQQGLPSGSSQQQRRIWGRGKKKNRSPPAWLLASTWARRTSGGPAIEDCEGNGLGGNSLGEDSEGGSGGAGGGGGGGGGGMGNCGGVGVGGGGILAPPNSTSRNHNGNIEVIVTSDSR